MRILHVSEVADGGTARLLMDFASHQISDGHEVHIAGPVSMEAVDGAVHHRWGKSRRHLHLIPTSILRLRSIIRTVSPDVLHLHSFFAGLYGRVQGGASTTRVVYQPHSWAFDSVESTVVRQAIVRVEAALAARTTAFALNCQDEMREAAAHGFRLRHARWLGVGVDLSVYRPYNSGERMAVRNRLGIQPHERVYLLAGRICRQKGQDLILPVWDADPPLNSILILAGPGDTTGLQELGSRTWGTSVKAIGHASAMVDWYNASDVMIAPSRYEGQSVAISEALACGLPVVAFNVNGAQAMIVDGPLASAGAVTRIGDVSELLTQAIHRSTDVHLRASESQMARRRSLLYSDPAVVHRRLDDLYDELMN